MKKKVKIALLVLFIALFMVMIGIMYPRNYALTIPQAETLKSIFLESQEQQEEITDITKIHDIIYVLSNSGKGRNTKKESISDSPVNANTVIKIAFQFAEGGTSIIFVYQKDNHYYIEQPYNGIYRISEDEYHSIETYVSK